MYRRLVTFGLTVVAVAVVALIIPLGMAAKDIVAAEEMNEIAERARVVADAWEVAWSRDTTLDQRPEIPVPEGDGNVTLILPSGEVLGPAIPPEAGTIVELAGAGRSATVDEDSKAFATAPVLLGDQTGIVLVTLDHVGLREGLVPRLIALAIVAFTLLAFAALAAWQLARRTANPILRLAETADAIADGDLSVRATESSMPEVQAVGVALNRLAVRVEELLEDERESAAELAHQLRTPLTVLTIDIDAVADEETRSRLQEDALELQRTTDEIITTARRSTREGLRARCNAAAVVADRARFWRVLADDQRRVMSVTIPDSELWVRLTEEDLTTLTDILLQNVFKHTPDGVPFALTLTPRPAGGATLELADDGPGFEDQQLENTPDQDLVDASAPSRNPQSQDPGSTGLGLSIARRLASASGGNLRVERDPSGGARVLVELGPATE